VLLTLLGQFLEVQIYEDAWTVKENTVVKSFKKCAMSNAVGGTI
jgi:hypothetical protein